MSPLHRTSFNGLYKLHVRDTNNVIDKQKATITFERPSAARTALLLQDAHLGTSQVHVSSSVPLEGSSTPPHQHTDEISQEDKPRTAVLAGIISLYYLPLPMLIILIEYLSHGYTLTDQALQRAIEYDHQTGISQRFYNLLNNAIGTVQGVDQKLGVTQRAVAVDEKYAIQERAKSTASGLMRYFENALDTPTGKKVRAFYDDRRKDVLQIHAEARRLADERKQAPSATHGESTTPATEVSGTQTTGLGATAATSEKA